MSFSAATATLIEQPALRADEQVIVMSGPYGDKEIGARIAEARTVEGLSQEGLGNLMRPRRSQGLVSAWERGARDPSTHDINEIARITGRPVAWLMCDPLGDFGLEFSGSWSSFSPQMRDEVVRFARYLAQRHEDDQRAMDAKGDGDESGGPEGAGGDLPEQPSEGGGRSRG